jgi:hypothetical protein
MVGSNDTALLQLFFFKIRSVRMLDTIVSLGAFCLAVWFGWVAVELTLEVGFVRPFVTVKFRGH